MISLQMGIPVGMGIGMEIPCSPAINLIDGDYTARIVICCQCVDIMLVKEQYIFS